MYIIWFFKCWIFDACFHSMSHISSTSKAYPTIQNQEFSACTTMLISPRIRERQSFCLTISSWLRSVLRCYVACLIISWNAGVFRTPTTFKELKRVLCFYVWKTCWDPQKINSAFHVSLSTCNYISSVLKKKFLISLFWHIFTFKICQWGFIFWQNEMYSLLILKIYC